MHSDDHILATFLISMPLIALARWLQRHTDLLAAVKDAMETRLKFQSLQAESVAVAKLTAVTSSTFDEERSRKGASQLLRHIAKRLLTNPGRKPGAPCASVRADNPAKERALPPSLRSSIPPNVEPRMPIAAASCAGPSSPKPTIAQRLAARRLAALDASRPIHC